MQVMSNSVTDCKVPVQSGGEFFGKLSAEAVADLISLEHATSYPSSTMLFSETDPANGVFVILEGEVKLSINSSDGRRLILRIAKKGAVLGLESVISGQTSEMTAETLYPSRIAKISRRDFLAFMMRHPEAYQIVGEELGRQIGMAYAQLRSVALSASAPEKLARLLLDFGQDGQNTEAGTCFRLSFTHEEIGEFIGTSRETVTRTLSAFKTRRLVDFHGSKLTIPNKTALASYAGC
jgi:CRP/FNR family transcriptional regulator, cyclic AMP receptor protein